MMNWLKKFWKQILAVILIPTAFAAVGAVGDREEVPVEETPIASHLSAQNYRGSTVLFIKPNCNTFESDCSDPTTSKAGDIVAIVDGDERADVLGDKPICGEKECLEYIIATTTKKLTATEMETYLAPEFAPLTAFEKSRDLAKGELLKSRVYGIDLTKVLTEEEMIRAEDAKAVLEVKIIDPTLIEDKGERISATIFPAHIIAMNEMKRDLQRLKNKTWTALIKNALAQVTVVKVVDPDNGTCDGETADYTTLALWEAQDRNLDSAGEIEEVWFCSTAGSANTGNVLIATWTTSATEYINMICPSSQRHDGKWNTAKCRQSYASAGTTAFDVRVNHMRMDGVQLELSSGSSATATTYNSQSQTAGADLRFSNMILRLNPGRSITGTGFSISDADTTVRMKNTVIYDHADSGSSRGISVDSTNGYYYNVTIFGAATGIRHFSGVSTTTNVVIASSTGNDITISGGTLNRIWTTGEDTTVGAGTGNDNSVSVASMDFVNYAATDFHINTGSVLKDDGIDLSADSFYAFSDDIDYATRSGTWDKGVDEISSAGGSAPSTFVPDGFIDWE